MIQCLFQWSFMNKISFFVTYNYYKQTYSIFLFSFFLLRMVNNNANLEIFLDIKYRLKNIMSGI